jgi:hypothetical protein
LIDSPIFSIYNLEKKQEMNVLMVAEKFSVAESISKILSNGTCQTSKGKAFGFWAFVKLFLL